MSSLVESIKSVKNPFTSSSEEVEPEAEDTSSFFSGVSKSLPKLSLKQRLIGFGVCLGIAALFAILGCALSYVSPPLFAVLFTLATIAGICSTFFLVSPIKQVKHMYDKNDIPKTIIRICCIVLLFFMIVLVFCAVFWWKIGGIGILFCIVEFICLVVYGITLIPFATTIISRGARSALSNM